MKRSLATAALLASALAACSHGEPQPEPPPPAPPPPPALTSVEIFTRFQELVPRLRDCFSRAPAGMRLPHVARVSFSYQSDEQGKVRTASLVKANFRFRELAPCLEQPLIGLQLDPSPEEERRISLRIELGK